MTPLQIALNKLEEFELLSKDNKARLGLVEKDKVVKILEEFEVDCLNSGVETEIEENKRCPNCYGDGKVKVYYGETQAFIGEEEAFMICPLCEGSGEFKI